MRGVRSDDFPALAVMMTLLPRLALALTGPHVCHQVENYTVTSPEHYVEPVEIHTFTWCLHIPPRCLQTRTELRDSWRMKTETKFKSVQVCCEGYAVQKPVQGGKGAEATCAPRCQRCLGGTCSAPNECVCRPGFQGRDCSYECPSGTWGDSCKNKCECLRGDGCDPASGECNCPAGWTGSRCESPKPRCDQEAGVCVGGGGGESEIDPYEASGTSANLVPATARKPDADYVEVVDFDREASLMARVTEQDSETPAVPSLPDELIPVRVDDGGPSTASPARPAAKTQSAEPSQEAPSSRLEPARPTVGGAAAAPSGGRLPQPDGPQRSSSFDFDEREANFRVIVSPKTDYVKTTRKGGHGSAMSAITIDVAAMIVVGALVSIGLTSVAVLMIFHVRSRLLKAALSIYGHHQGKAERRYGEKEASHQSPGKGLDVNVGTLPRGTMTRVNPIYDAGSELGSAVLTMDERPAEYANGTVTIGIRLSSNIRDLLESHYDRPASCSHRSGGGGGGGGATAPMASAETDVEHVYDEIPLAAPFYFAKST